MNKEKIFDISIQIAEKYAYSKHLANKETVIAEIRTAKLDTRKSILGSLSISDIISVGGLIWSVVKFIYEQHKENKETPNINEISNKLKEQRAVPEQEALEIYKISLKEFSDFLEKHEREK